MSKLTREQREEMIARAVAGEKHLALAVEYGISESSLGNLLRRRGHYRTRPAAAPKPSKTREPWRRLDWDRIAALNARGLWAGAIAEALGCTAGAVRYALAQMGHTPQRAYVWRAERYGGAPPVPGVTPKPSSTPRRYDWTQMAELHAQGASAREIADKVGCTVNAVRYALKVMR